MDLASLAMLIEVCVVLHRISDLVCICNLIVRYCELGIIKQLIFIIKSDILHCQTSLAVQHTLLYNLSMYSMKCVC